jgi:hypothetical protein
MSSGFAISVPAVTSGESFNRRLVIVLGGCPASLAAPCEYEPLGELAVSTFNCIKNSQRRGRRLPGFGHRTIDRADDIRVAECLV